MSKARKKPFLISRKYSNQKPYGKPEESGPVWYVKNHLRKRGFKRSVPKPEPVPCEIPEDISDFSDSSSDLEFEPDLLFDRIREPGHDDVIFTGRRGPSAETNNIVTIKAGEPPKKDNRQTQIDFSLDISSDSEDEILIPETPKFTKASEQPVLLPKTTTSLRIEILEERLKSLENSNRALRAANGRLVGRLDHVETKLYESEITIKSLYNAISFITKSK